MWTLYFVSEVNNRRESLVSIIGQKTLIEPYFLLLDGHKSRLNTQALELFRLNNIRVIIFPAHTFPHKSDNISCNLIKFQAVLQLKNNVTESRINY